MIQDEPIWREMMSGNVYCAVHEGLIAELNRVKTLVRRYNDLPPEDLAAMDEAIRGLLGRCGNNIKVLQPFRCDYGCNITVGENFFANFNLTILDEAKVTIGDNVFIGPNVSIYTACHPTDPDDRRDGREWSLPVTIGSDCWIGGNVVILPGVEIGEGATIGAGSVVSRSIPPRSVAVGNPARVIKRV